MRNLQITLLISVILFTPFLTACSPNLIISPLGTVQAKAASFETLPCTPPFPTGPSIRCGYLIVPEQRSTGNGKLIRLPVIIYKAAGPGVLPDPVLFLNGGPGSFSLANADLIYAHYQNVIGQRDFIILEQRGAGVADPSLTCPEYFIISTSIQKNSLSDDQLLQIMSQAGQACHERLVKAGVNLDAFNTVESAADVADLRSILRIQQWNLLGLSYGTRLALITMRDHPEGIRSVILDSAVPPDKDLISETAQNTAQSLDQIFTQCSIDNLCNASYPDLKASFLKILNEVDTQPILVSKSESFTVREYLLTSSTLISSLQHMLAAPRLIPWVPKIIHKLSIHDYILFSMYAEPFMTEYNPEFSLGAYFSTICKEGKAPSDEWTRLIHPVSDYPDSFITYFQRDAENISVNCSIWNLQPADPEEGQPVMSSIPTLIFAGEFDPYSPPEWGKSVAQGLSRSTYIEFKGIGHSVLGADQEGCSEKIANGFLQDPEKNPDQSCIETIPFHFYTDHEIAMK